MNLQESIRKDLDALNSKIINESFTAVAENGFSMDVELRANSLDELWDMIEEWYHSDPRAREATGVPYDREMEAQLIDDTLTISNYIFGVEKDGEMLSAEEMNSVNQFDSDGEIVAEDDKDTFTYNHEERGEQEVDERDKYIMGVLAKLREVHKDLGAHGIELKSWGSSGNSMEMLYNDLMEKINRSAKYYLKVPALDRGEAEHSHPFLG
jgi:hypothetical protein